jgi:hypothetical protein
MNFDRLPRHPLPFDLGDRRAGELIRHRVDTEKGVDAQRLIDPLRTLRRDVG